jgi:hypothetical protein
MVAPTPAQLFRLPEFTRGVQVWDEIERKEETDKQSFNAIQPVLLNGYRNGGAVPRQVGKAFQKAAKFHVFCPRVLIGLTKLPEPARQRTITVQLVKRFSEQKIEHYIGAKRADEERGLRERCLIWALKTVERVNGFYQDEKLRSELEALVGAGRASDDIWLPVFAVASAGSQGEGSFMGSLKNAATELSTPSVEGNSPYDLDEGSTELSGEPKREVVQKAALSVLEEAVPITPENLAKAVSENLGTDVTSQKLSKSLSKLGIRAWKEKGRRIFKITNEALASAYRKLGIDRNGQQGQQGQQHVQEVEPAVHLLE